jgi:hypothetical protein
VRKKAIKKMYPHRGQAFKILRKRNYIRELVDRSGHIVALNFTKHLLLGKPYIHEEYQAELARFMQTAINRQEQEEKAREEAKNEAEGKA